MIERVIQLHSKELGFALGIPKVYQVQVIRIEAILMLKEVSTGGILLLP